MQGLNPEYKVDISKADERVCPDLFGNIRPSINIFNYDHDCGFPGTLILMLLPKYFKISVYYSRKIVENRAVELDNKNKNV